MKKEEKKTTDEVSLTAECIVWVSKNRIPNAITNQHEEEAMHTVPSSFIDWVQSYDDWLVVWHQYESYHSTVTCRISNFSSFFW